MAATTGSIAKNLTYASTSNTFVGNIPANSILTQIRVLVGTAFNSGGADIIEVGISTDIDKYADNVDVSATGSASVTLLNVGAVISTTSPTAIYAKYTPANTSPTAGSAYVVVEYAQL